MAEGAVEEDGRTKVLWLTKGLGPGGAERLLLSFAQNADHDRFELHAAYLLPWKDHLVADLQAAGVTAHCLSGPRWWDLRWLWRLRRLIREERFAVVHNHSPLVAAQARLLVRTLPRYRRPRMITTEHNMWGSHQRVTRTLNAATIGLDDHVFAVSDQVRDSMSAKVRDRVEVLIHGVDVEAIAARRGERTEARAEHGFTDDDFVVVTVANLRANKDYPTMLRAARKLVDDGVPVTFLAVGQGPLEDELHALRDELRLGDRFRFLGYRSDPIRTLVAGDVFCLSSAYEGLPIALLEALALGLPTASTSVGGIPDVVQDHVHGRMVPRANPRALASAIAHLSSSDVRTPMSARALTLSQRYGVLNSVSRVQSSYSPDTSPHRTLKVLQVVTDDTRRGAQVFAVDLQNALVRQGIAVSTVALASETADGLSVEALGPSRRHLRTAWALRRLARAVDVVIAHGSTTLMMAVLSTTGTHTPVVYRQISDTKFWAPNFLRRVRVGALMRRTAHVVALAQQSKEVLVEYLGVSPNRITVIPNGVPRDGFCPPSPQHRRAARDDYGVGDKFCIAYIGALVPEKGVDVAIDALAGDTRSVLLIAGDGPDLSRLRARAIAQRCDARFLGAVDGPVDVLAAADVLVLPSRGGDSMPAVLIEAAFALVPVVTTPIGAIGEVVRHRDTGLLIPTSDAHLLKLAIDELRASPALAADIRNAARAHAIERFDIGVVARRWLEVCRSTLRQDPLGG